MIALSLIVLAALAQTPVFEDDFSYGYENEWRIADPLASVDGPSLWQPWGGVLYQSSRICAVRSADRTWFGTRFYLAEPTFEDGTYVARLSSQERNGVALLFRVRDAKHYYRFFLFGNSDLGGPFVRIDRRDGDTVKVLAESAAPLTWPFGLWWNLAVQATGNEFTASINGETVLTARDSVFKSGGIGVACWANAGVCVDRLSFFEEEASALPLKPEPAIVKGPCLWRLEPTRFRLTWETSVPAPSVVTVMQGKEPAGTVVNAASGDESRLFHSVEVTGLTPRTNYRYHVECAPVSSPWYMVTTPLEERQAFRFAVYGNSRSQPGIHAAVAESIAARSPNFVVNVGGAVSNGSSYDEWRRDYFDPADSLVHTTPAYLCRGEGETNNPWLGRFTALPGNGCYYSFREASGFFVILDSNKPMTPGSEQLRWLEQEVKSDAAQNARWRFCFFHHPAYTERGGNYDGTKEIRKFVMPLLERAGFQIVFSGKVAAYERGELNNLVHVLTGGGGAPLDLAARPRPARWPHIEICRAVHHACLVEVDGDQLRFSAFTPTGKVFDSFELSR